MLNHEIDAFCRGEGHDAWRWLGAHQDGDGFRFVVWAPRAAAVAVVGDFTGWDQAPLPLTRIDDRGFWMVSGPGQPGQLYKLAITGPDGVVRLKADPFARHAELPPGTASRLVGPAPAPRPLPGPRCERPLIYEVHPGSWRKPHGQVPTWRQLADTLVPYVAELGYTHIELMGVAEHPFTGSWGYQITGYFAPTARHGDPAGLRALVEACHQAGLGLIVDWVPAHFVTDEYALARFDGLPLFEHPDPRRGFHPDWHTLIFDYGRPEVRSFLIASALYWLEAFGFDGLRVDAVASMLYLDYSRKDGEWEPNHLGGRENLEAMAFLRAATDAVHARRPDAWLIAEESTAFPGVTRSTAEGGLGFDLKWNLGWMHDTLAYLQTDPLFRSHDHDRLTFPIVYEWSERFVNPLSHDEVVHAKGSLLNKMFGDEWARFAQLRALLVYQHTRPGAVHLFMGSELAPHTEWDHDGELPWSLLEKPAHAGVQRLVHDLARIARRPELAEGGPEGFAWIDCTDRDQSVIAWVRRRGGDAHLVVVLHFTPVHRDAYRIGVPSPAPDDLLLGTDDVRYGGPRTEGRRYHPEPVEWHGQPWSILIELPGSSGLILVPDPGADPSALHELSRRLGVVDRFWDVVGTRHDTTDATRRVLVAALGYPADDQAETTRSLAALDRVPALPTSP